MAEKIAIQIALEGGQEVARQLEGIGEAGQKAFADIAKSAEQVGGFKNIKPEEVTAKLKALGIEGPAAIQKMQQAVATAARFESLAQGVQAVQAAFVALGRAAVPIGAAIAVGLQAAIKATIAFAEEVNKASAAAIKIGAGIQQYDRLRLGLEKAGISADAAADGIAHFQKQLGPVSTISFTGLGQAGNVIKLIGETSNSAAQQLPKFVEQLRQMPDSAERSALAIEKLGPKLGPQLIQALRTGGVAVDQFKQRWGELTPQMEAAANRIEQAQNRLSSAFNRLNTLSLAPVIIGGLDAATGAVERLGAALETSPWGVFLQAASFALNPIAGTAQQATKAILGTGAAAAQAGQQAAQAGVGFTQFGTAVQQSATGATVTFTQFGTVAQQAGQQAAQAGEQAAQGGQQAAAGAQQATTTWSEFVSAVASATWDTISSELVGAWDLVISAIQVAIDKVKEFIGLQPSAPATGGGAPGAASGGLLGGRGTGTSDSNLAWVSRGEYITPARAVRQPGVLAFLEALRRSGGKIPGFAAGGPLGSFAADFATLRLPEGRLTSILQEIQRIIEAIVDNANRLIDVSNSLVEEIRGARGGARGGLLGGRGTGTSDSNLAWLSRGEHVMPARAVRQPGVLAFLEALRRSGGNLSAVLDGMGRFALGGLVPRPAFAAGGAVGSMSNVTINFPGSPSISGLRASAAVVDELRKAAALAQVRSGGRKPSRYS